MGKITYGEFKFGKSPAKPTSKGYAKGGEASKSDTAQDKAMIKKAFKQHDAQEHKGGKGTDLKLKKGGNVKMVGMKREPEAIVKKEIALLKKAGAPAKIIKHEEREMVEPMMKKGGKVKKYADGGGVFEGIKDTYMEGVKKVGDDFQRIAGTEKGKQLDKEAQKEMYKRASNAAMKAVAQDIKNERVRAEAGRYKKGGKVKKYAEGGGPTAKGPMTEGERQKMKMQMAKEAEMDRKMRQAQKDMPTNQRMLDDAMNPLSALKEAYERVTDRSGQSATENMKRYGMKKGGVPTHNRSPKIC